MRDKDIYVVRDVESTKMEYIIVGDALEARGLLESGKGIEIPADPSWYSGNLKLAPVPGWPNWVVSPTKHETEGKPMPMNIQGRESVYRPLAEVALKIGFHLGHAWSRYAVDYCGNLSTGSPHSHPIDIGLSTLNQMIQARAESAMPGGVGIGEVFTKGSDWFTWTTATGRLEVEARHDGRVVLNVKVNRPEGTCLDCSAEIKEGAVESIRCFLTDVPYESRHLAALADLLRAITPDESRNLNKGEAWTWEGCILLTFQDAYPEELWDEERGRWVIA